jgi:hypothetical protein
VYQDLLVIEVSRSHSDSPHSVEIQWKCLARRREHYLAIHNTYKRLTSIYTTDQQVHYSDNLLIHSTAPTCFDVFTSSSGSLLMSVLLSYIRDSYGLYYDRGVGGRTILKWIFRKWDVGVRTGLGWLRIETGDRHL